MVRGRQCYVRTTAASEPRPHRDTLRCVMLAKVLEKKVIMTFSTFSGFSVLWRGGQYTSAESAEKERERERKRERERENVQTRTVDSCH